MDDPLSSDRLISAWHVSRSMGDAILLGHYSRVHGHVIPRRNKDDYVINQEWLVCLISFSRRSFDKRSWANILSESEKLKYLPVECSFNQLNTYLLAPWDYHKHNDLYGTILSIIRQAINDWLICDLWNLYKIFQTTKHLRSTRVLIKLLSKAEVRAEECCAEYNRPLYDLSPPLVGRRYNRNSSVW